MFTARASRGGLSVRRDRRELARGDRAVDAETVEDVGDRRGQVGQPLVALDQRRIRPCEVDRADAIRGDQPEQLVLAARERRRDVVGTHAALTAA